jgi:hypothetical protein
MAFIDGQGIATCSTTCYGKLSNLVRVESIIVTRDKKLRVTFDRGMKDNAALVMPFNYSPLPTTPGAIPLSVNLVTPEDGTLRPTYVDLEISEMTQGASYECSVSTNGPVDSDDTGLDPDFNSGSFTGRGGYPKIKNLIAQSKNRVDVVFDEPMTNNPDIREISKYTFDNGLAVLNILEVVDDTVKLVTSDQVAGALYTLTIDTGGVTPEPPTALLWTPSVYQNAALWSDLSAVEYNDGRWIAVGTSYNEGNAAQVLVSSDHWIWRRKTIPELSEDGSNGLYDLVYGNEIWLAVGNTSTGALIVESDDNGSSWYVDSIGSIGDGPKVLYSIEYHDGTWIAVGSNEGSAFVLGYTEGDEGWTERTTPGQAGINLDCITYGNGLWVAGGGPTDNGPLIVVSANGVDWTVQTVADCENCAIYSVKFANNLFVGVGINYNDSSAIIVTSPNGTAWTKCAFEVPEGFESVCLDGIAFGGDVWVATGESNGNQTLVLISSDGIYWYPSLPEETPEVSRALYAAGYGDDVFVAVGSSNGNDSYILTSDTATPPEPPPTLDWFEVVPTTPSSSQLYDIAYGNGVWIAVGDTTDYNRAYLIRTTDGGISWSELANPRNAALNGIAYGDRVWIAVGSNDHGVPAADAYLLRSTDDGETWSEIVNPNHLNLVAVAHGNGVWIAVGESYGGTQDAYMIRSADYGTTWTEITNPKHLTLFDVAYNEGTWIAVGSSDSDAYILRSTDDGLTWTEIANPSSAGLEGVVYANGAWVAVGDADTGQPAIVYSSDDGLTWTLVDNTDMNTELDAVAYGDSMLLAVGWNDGVGSDALSAISFNNGQNWYEVENPQQLPLVGVEYGNGAFFAVGQAAYMMATAINAPPEPPTQEPLTWTLTSSGFSTALYRLENNHEFWICAGSDGHISSSPIGDEWTLQPTALGVSFIYRVTFGHNLWAISGNGARFSTSSNGTSWTTRTTPFDFYDVAYGSSEGHNVWTGVSALGQLAISQNDGVSWTTLDSGQTGTLREVVFIDNELEGQRWVTIGDAGALSMSYDGTSWAACNSQFGSSNINHCVHGGHIWVIVGNDGKLSTSTNSVTWTARDSKFGSSHIYYAAYGDGVWIIVGQGGKVATSYDGINWRLRDSDTTANLCRVAYCAYGYNGDAKGEGWGGRFVAVGDGGVIISSSNYGTEWVTNPNPFGSSNLYGVACGDGVWIAIGDGGKLAYGIGV